MSHRPDLFIIGAPKSGTTSLYEYLEGHPDVYMSPVKEPNYFSPDVIGGPRRRFVYGEDTAQYLDLFAKARGESRLAEASTRYLSSALAPGLIRDFEPAARIVAIIRNPIDVMYALHNERVSDGLDDIVEFEQALAADGERQAGRRLREGANSQWSVYRNWARFGEQLERWIEIFGRERVHVIVFDEFAADTPGEFRRLLQFLEIDPEYKPMSFAARRPSHRRRGGIVRRIVVNRATRGAAHRLLPALIGRNSAARLVWNFRQSRLNRKRHVRRPLGPDLRRRLEEELKPDVRRLSGLLGRDLVQLWFGHAADVAPDQI